MEDLNFKNRDFYTTAVCIASGAKLIGLERNSNDFASFILNISPKEGEQIIAKHWSRELKIPSRDLIEAINELKTRLHSGV